VRPPASSTSSSNQFACRAAAASASRRMHAWHQVAVVMQQPNSRRKQSLQVYSGKVKWLPEWVVKGCRSPAAAVAAALQQQHHSSSKCRGSSCSLSRCFCQQ
jgi:hypothetical protein